MANRYADKCKIQVSYAIGIKQPMSIYLNTLGTNKIPDYKIIEKIKDRVDLTPQRIIQYLELQKPIYRQTTNCRYFGKKN